MSDNQTKGIALVAVLAILVVLAILAATFVTLMNIESKQSDIQANAQQLDMLLNSGAEQAKAEITVAKGEENRNITNGGKYSKWYIVKDKTGKIIGRYRIKIEDEAGKVNVEKAYLLKKSRGTGWDTGEVNLPKALSVSPKIAKKLINFRYGKNKLPGARGDDDQNNLLLMADGIDNNANGIIDEPDEGVNDPKEYMPEYLKGDDRKFTTMTELMNVIISCNKNLSTRLQRQIMREIPKRATIYSVDITGSPTLPNEQPADINSITPRECRKILIKANAKEPFEPNSSKQMQLAANLVDYRDENHVLSTLGSTYGVEAICFNEILANDESGIHDIAMARKYLGVAGSGYWREGYGIVDDKRPVYCVDVMYGCIPDSPSILSKRYQALDPRRMWRIKKGEIGKLKILGNKVKITFGDTIGDNGKDIIGNIYMIGNALTRTPADVAPGQKNCFKWPSASGLEYVFPSSSKFKSYCNDMLNVLSKIKMRDGNKKRPKLPKNYFRNSLAMVYKWQKDAKDKRGKCIGVFKITSGDQESITFESKNYYNNSPQFSFDKMMLAAGMTNDDYDLSVSINSWANKAAIAWVPKANQMFLVRTRQPIAGRYFKVVFCRLPKAPKTLSVSGMEGYSDKLGVSQQINGPFEVDKNFEKRMWVCNEGKPMMTKAGGWLNILVTSSPEVNRLAQKGQMLAYLRLIAPEVAEMYNASATPVSLANWRVICNTGSLATQIGRIRHTAYYDQKLRRRIIDNNPIVKPRGHFYLVNDTELFDCRYGNADNLWGSTADEQVPVFQMDEENWGVSYKIETAKLIPGHGYTIRLQNFNYDVSKDFRNETVKIIDEKNKNNPYGWNNVMVPARNRSNQGVQTSTKEFFFTYFGDMSKLKNAKLMILGLPASGGFVSLTLKNEYDQICARTVDYGRLEPEELGMSTEKIDPTKNTWVKNKTPTIGGTENKAENRAMKSHHNDKFFIKNGLFCSVGEVRNVSTGNDFERLGEGGNISKGAIALAAIANFMSSSQIRLESCLGDVTRAGWNEAYGEVAGSTLRSVRAKKANWEANMWKGHTLRFLTGPLRGEKFPIIGNSKNTIILSEKNSKYIPRSAPNRKALKPNIDDKFSIGPGYATPMCYTRKSGEQGVWTWKNAIPVPGTYNLYIYGLNDAIDTTEFLEENNNASLDVELWNYKTKKFDFIKKKGKYGKQDSFNAGKIRPENISSDGDVKIRLTPHNVVERNTEDKSGKTTVGSGGKQTGFAWFNYAVVSPVPVEGRVNINTASQRLLASLPGISPALAKNIFEGINQNGNKVLKPYKQLGDLFKVKGMTPDIFEKCVNLLTIDSSVYTVEVEAQLLKGKITDKKINQNSIIAEKTKRFVVDITKDNEDYVKAKVVERFFIK